jgi:dTDP-4-amino-4,6-dideoxygalactose transaminase
MQKDDTYSAYHLYPIRISPKKTNISQKQTYRLLNENGIQANIHYIPVYRQPYYERLGFKQGYCPEAERYHQDAISIPMYASLSEADQASVISVLHDVLG